MQGKVERRDKAVMVRSRNSKSPNNVLDFVSDTVLANNMKTIYILCNQAVLH